jgi:AraC-like DNA-binding protein
MRAEDSGAAATAQGIPLDSIPSTSFLTEAFDADDQFDAWREVISVVFNVAPLERGAAGDGFFARANAFHLGDLVLVNTRFDGQRFLRTDRDIRADWLDHYLVQYYRDGGYVGTAGGEALAIPAGSVSVLDLAQPVDTRATAAECLSLVVPRDLLESVVPSGEAMHGKILDNAAGGLLGDYLASLERRLPGLDAAQTPDIVRATCHLVGACLRPSADALAHSRAQVDALLVARIRRHVDQGIRADGGAGITPDSLGRGLGVSRSRLYALLKPHGGVRRFIQGRRLLWVHAALAAPGSRKSIMALAERYGFGSHAHLSRAFRQQYGYSPSDVREHPAAILQSRAAVSPAGAGAAPGFDDWIRALRG